MKLSSTAYALGVVAAGLPSAYAWGGLGHETVAFIASGFLNQKGGVFFHTMLGDTSEQYLAKVATWADSYRYSKGGQWSAPLHFIDSEDNPPSSCSVDYNRDCTIHGCVVGAIQNYTARLLDASLEHSERIIAAKFLVHFIGDIHQPLHDENLEKGGNGIHVVFDGTPVNLHAIWDTNMPEKLVGGYSLVDAQRWATELSNAIKTGEYQSEAAQWLEGLDLNDPISTAMIWASEANTYVCSTVMPNGAAALDGQELSNDYYATAIPVIKLQIARAGYRLAAWLNMIASGSTAGEL